MPDTKTKTQRLGDLERLIGHKSVGKIIWWIMGGFGALTASVVAGWIGTTNSARYEHVQRLTKVETQIDSVDKRTEKVELRLSGVEAGLERMGQRIGSLEARQNAVEAKVDKMDSKLDEILKRMPK